jgi:hypothetical protein
MGELFLNREFYCYSMEPPNPIPARSYDLVLRPSLKFGRIMPHVENVPGHTAIEIHWGNWPQDTSGCLLVGMMKGPTPDFIGESHLAFNGLYERLREAEEANYITYLEEVEI